VRHAFLAFFCILSAYFLQLPTRDEAGVALGALAVHGSSSVPFTLVALPVILKSKPVAMQARQACQSSSRRLSS